MSIYKQHYKKNIRNIAFRFDADESIGFGHLIRVKGFIYRNLNNFDKFILITKSNKRKINLHFLNKKIKIYYLNVQNFHKLENVFKILLFENCKVLVSDISYKQNLKTKNFFQKYYNYLKKKKILSISIDDPRQYINSDVSIIPNTIVRSNIRKNKLTKIFVGTKYICFNNDLTKSRKKIKKNPNNILISIGSDDKKNYSLKILKSILKLNLPIKIRVLLNKKRISKFRSLQKKYKNINLITNISNMDSLLNWSDIFIGGEGLSKFEAALKGVPHIFINNVENDKKDMQIISQFLKLKTSFFFKIQNFDSIRFNLLFLKLFKNTKLRRKYSKNGLKILDLKGAERVYKVINTFYKKFNVSND